MAARKRVTAPRSRKASKFSDRSFLIVDDDAAFTEVVRAWAKRHGARATVVRDGREALERIQREDYDALIVDLKMPGMDGYELHLRLAVERPDLLRRTVFVTGDRSNPEAEEFLARSDALCLEKPFDLSDLEEAVRDVL